LTPAVRIVASIDKPAAIRAILGHFAKHGALGTAHYRPGPPGPPGPRGPSAAAA
jgi:hypothetical protein